MKKIYLFLILASLNFYLSQSCSFTLSTSEGTPFELFPREKQQFDDSGINGDVETNRRNESQYQFEKMAVETISYDTSTERLIGSRTPDSGQKKETSKGPVIASLSCYIGGFGIMYFISVYGSNFTDGIQGYFNQEFIQTAYIDSKNVSIVLDTNLSSKYQNFIWLKDKDGHSSNRVEFNLVSPGNYPNIRYLNPQRGKTGSSISISLYTTQGYSGLPRQFEIFFNGKPIKHIRISRTEVKIPNLDLKGLTPGKYPIYIKYCEPQEHKKNSCLPDTCNSTSSFFEVIELHPKPVIDRVLPFDIQIGSEKKLIIYGDFFDSNSKVYIAKKLFSSRFISEKQIEVIFKPIEPEWKQGDYQLVVENNVKKKSNSFNLTIYK